MSLPIAQLSPDLAPALDSVGFGRWLAEQAPAEVPHLPPMAHTAVGVALVVGLMLWAFGGKVVKPAFAVLGFVAGGLIGMMLAPALGIEDAFGLEATTLAMLGGGIGGVFLAAMLFRLAMTATATIALGSLGLMAGLVAAPHLELEPPDALASFVGDAPGDNAEQDELAAWADQPLPDGSRALLTGGRPRAVVASDPVPLGLAHPDALAADSSGADGQQASASQPRGAEALDAFAEEASAFAAEASRRVSAFATQLWDATKVAFAELEARERYTVGVFTLGGAALGLLLGSLAPRKAASLVTALFGSAVWMAALVWTMLALQLPGTDLLDQPPVNWAMGWGIVALVGMVYQAGSSGQKPASEG